MVLNFWVDIWKAIGVSLGCSQKILRYIEGSIDLGLFYNYDNELKLYGYSHNDWGGDQNQRKSIAGCVLSWIVTFHMDF